MQHDTTFSGPFHFIQKILMIIGMLLFIVLSSATMMQTASPQAARNTADPQPELKATAVFSR